MGSCEPRGTCFNHHPKTLSKPYLTKVTVELVFCCKISAGTDEFLPPGQVPFAPLGDSLGKSLPPGLFNGKVRQ